MVNTFYEDVRKLYDLAGWFPLRDTKNTRLWLRRTVILISIIFQNVMGVFRSRKRPGELGFFVFFVIASEFYTTFMRRDKAIDEIVETMADIDRILKKSSVSEPEVRWQPYYVAMVAKLLSIVLMRALQIGANLWTDDLITWYYNDMAQTVRSLVYYFLFDFLLRRFTVFVYFMTNRSIKLRKAVIQQWSSGVGWQRRVMALMDAHDSLQDAIAKLNHVWNHSLVLVVFSVFSSLVGGTLQWCQYFRTARFGFRRLLSSFVFFYVWLWNLFDLTYYTQQCEEQANRFNPTLYSLLMSTSKIESSNQEFLDALLIKIGRKNKTVFSVHGLHLMNYTLVHTVLAGVISTVIIVLQTKYYY